jgi:hypothetical protein
MHHLDLNLSIYSDIRLFWSCHTIAHLQTLRTLAYVYCIRTDVSCYACLGPSVVSCIFTVFILFSCIFILYIYFSDMFYIQWFCNPLDWLNENEIQYNTIQLMWYNHYSPCRLSTELSVTYDNCRSKKCHIKKQRNV